MSATDSGIVIPHAGPRQIDRNQPIAVTLTLAAGHWEAVMQVLNNGPYGVVAPLISSIQQQCMRHAEVPPPTNGAAATTEAEAPCA
jgi:hypothetical protein